VLKLGTEGVTEHLLQGQEKCKLQFMLESKLDKKWFHRKLINLLLSVASE